MNNLNSILIEGNMVKDPLLRTTPKGTAVCTFALASNRFYRHDAALTKETGFFTVETWGKLAEACQNRGKKGRGVRVVGRLKQDRWNGADGRARSRIAIVAEHVEFRPEFKKDGAGSPAPATAEEAAMPDYIEEAPPLAAEADSGETAVMTETLESIAF